MITEVLVRTQLRKIPPRCEGVQPVHECRVVAHLRRHRTEQVADLLLLLDIHVEVSHHHNAAVRPDILLPPTELARGHVALHDVDAVLLIEGDAGDLIEADNVIVADEPPLPRGVVHKHLGYRGLAAGDQVGVGRDLLEEVALAGAPRPQLDQIVVALDKRDHPEQRHTLGPFVQRRRFQADRPQQYGENGTLSPTT